MLSLLRLERKQNNYSNPFPIRIFLFLSYSSGIETISTFIHSVVPSKTQPDSRPKWAKCIPVFRPKRRKNPTRWGGTYVYGLYKGVAPPLPRALLLLQLLLLLLLYVLLLLCAISASTLLLLPLTTTTATATSAPVTTNTYYTTSASACYATGDLKGYTTVRLRLRN